MPVVRVIKRTWKEFQKDRVTDLAAMLTYYALFALFPFMLFLVTLTLLVLPRDVLDQAFKMVAFAMPGQVSHLALDQLRRMEATAASGFAVVGALLAIYSASRGAVALQTALNQMFEVKDQRPWWKQQLIAVATTLGVSVLALVALVILLFGPSLGHLVADRLGLGGAFDLVWGIGRWVGAALLVMLVWACLYYFLPDIHRAFRWITPGAVIGVLLWLAASRGFIFYTDSFASYNKTYGTLGGVIVFLTWLWLSCAAFLVGGEIDDAIETVRDNRDEPKKPAPAGTKESVIVEREIHPAGRALAITDLAKRVGDDLSALAKDHFELARVELARGIREAAADLTLMVLGGVVALIGLAMLCVTAVVAFEPIINALWLRLLLGALVYLAIGGSLVAVFAVRLRGVKDTLDESRRQARATARVLEEQVQHG